jgi:hypothetical protein
MIITLLQSTQMIIGCWINLKAWQYKNNGEMCQVTDENLKVSLVMYGTYFLLFAHFFLGSYIFKSSLSRGKKQKEEIIKKID